MIACTNQTERPWCSKQSLENFSETGGIWYRLVATRQYISRSFWVLKDLGELSLALCRWDCFIGCLCHPNLTPLLKLARILRGRVLIWYFVLLICMVSGLIATSLGSFWACMVLSLTCFFMLILLCNILKFCMLVWVLLAIEKYRKINKTPIYPSEVVWRKDFFFRVVLTMLSLGWVKIP